MVPDVLSVVLKTMALIAALQATGGALFLALFRRQMSGAIVPVAQLVRLAAWTGIFSLLGHTWLETARMAGALSGLLDPALIELLVRSPTMAVLALRVLSLCLVLAALRRHGTFQTMAGVLGALLFSAAFALSGHTTTHPERALLAPTLMLHLLIVGFWFGALLPLHLVSRREEPGISAGTIERFSGLAVRTVPLIFVAGLLLLWRLLPAVEALSTPYGLLLLGKISGFALLMLLAALNKWRFGPGMAGDPGAQGAFRRSVLVEFLLISIILAMTAAMTTFFSPEG